MDRKMDVAEDKRNRELLADQIFYHWPVEPTRIPNSSKTKATTIFISN